MRYSILAQALYGTTLASPLAVSSRLVKDAVDGPAKSLPLDQFNRFHAVPLDQSQQQQSQPASTSSDNAVESTGTEADAAAGECANPSVRPEWLAYSENDRQNLLGAINCLYGKPSAGNYPPSHNRYEDFVQVHHALVDSIHGNNLFLLWHRYFLWSFEQVLRDECGLTAPLPWWEEPQNAGNFAASSVFTDAYYGSLPGPTNGQGTCITDGQFKNVVLHIAPDGSDTEYCLARAVDESNTAQVTQDFVNSCNSRSTYPDMEGCSETGPHAYGHNGIGSIMSDVSVSVGDPTFFLHHAFIDHNYRIWQNVADDRKSTISGCADSNDPCTALTLDTVITLNGLKPDVTVRDVINTLDGVMCYKYDR